MDETYEGGDFCSGLTVAFEVRRIGMEVVQTVITNMFNHDSDDTDTKTLQWYWHVRNLCK